MKLIQAPFQKRSGGPSSIFMLVMILLGLLPVHSAWGKARVYENFKIVASDGDYIGRSVSVSGDVALVGGGAAVYIYRWTGSTWVEEQTLLLSDGEGRFSSSVSVSGDVALVGNGTAAYIYRWTSSTWVEEQTLLPSDGESRFGSSVSVSGDVALVGGSAVYIYRWTGNAWVEEQKLPASDSVSVSGDVALVGSGAAAYIYRWTGSAWLEEQKLLASDGDDDYWDSFGSSVSVSGDVALVGAYEDDDQGDYSGSAYIYRWSGSAWMEEQKLLASDGDDWKWFGSSVSVNGDVALVGADGDDNYGDSSGAAYIYRWTGSAWVEEQKLLASDGAAGDLFGSSVSVSGDVVLVGTHFNNDKGFGSGAAYVFDTSHWIFYGDLNDDGVVDRADMDVIRSHCTNPVSVCPECDINGDGTINISDARKLMPFCTNVGCR